MGRQSLLDSYSKQVAPLGKLLKRSFERTSVRGGRYSFKVAQVALRSIEKVGSKVQHLTEIQTT